MRNIFDYLVWRGDLDFSSDPPNEVDALILARASYLPFDGFVSKEASEQMAFSDFCKALMAEEDFEKRLLFEEDKPFLEKLALSRRFAQIGVSAFVNEISEASETQFSAVTFEWMPKHYCVAFRGTDNTLIGWKEDFNMSFTFPVPAQTSSRLYVENLENFLADAEEIVLIGHSKGGNLAIYAGLYSKPELRRKISKIYNFDGPGFPREVLETEAYRELAPRILTYLPRSSVVGILLEQDEDYTIVNSHKEGIFQHDILTWDVLGKSLVRLDGRSNTSFFVDHTLRNWIAEMSVEQRERFVDLVYELMCRTEAKTLDDLSENWFDNARVILRSVTGMNAEDQKVIKETLRILFKSTAVGFVRSLKGEKRPVLPPMKTPDGGPPRLPEDPL